MPLTPDQQTWAVRMLGARLLPTDLHQQLSPADRLAARNADERRDMLKRRAAEAGDAARRLEAHVPVLTEVAEVELQVRSGMTGGKSKGTQTLRFVGVDPSETYGHRHDIPVSSFPPKLLQQLYRIEGDFAEEARRLEALRADWTVLKGDRLVTEERPLFDKAGIHDAVYAPFVRRGLFPEDQIMSHFSRTHDMIQESNKLYLEELAGVEDQPDWTNTVSQAQGLLSSLATGLVGGTGLGTTVDPTFHDTAVQITHLTGIIDTSLKTITGSVVLFAKADAEGAVKTLLTGVGGAVGAAIGGDIGKYVTLGLKAGATAPQLMKVLRTSKTEGEVAAGLLTLLGDAVTIGVGLDNLVKTDPVAEKQATVFATHLQTALNGLAKAFEKDLIGALKAARQGDLSALQRWALDFGAAAGAEVGVAITSVFSAQVIAERTASLDPKTNPQYQQTAEYQTFLEAVQGKNLDGEALAKAWTKYAGEVAAGWSRMDGALLAQQTGGLQMATGALSKLIDPSKLQVKVKAREEEAQEQEAIELEERAWEEELEAGGVKAEGEAAARLGQLVVQLQQRRMVFTLVAGVVKGGAAAVARFWGVAAAAGTLMDLITQVKQAVETHQELMTWRRSEAYAENAVSPYFSSIVSFVSEQERLFPRDVVRSVMTAIKLGAQVAQAEPTFGLAIGKLIEGIEGVAESSMDLICGVIDAQKVEDAWTLTRAALEDPENRKAALVARKLNPTLAKYTLAWGALIAKDVVAREAMAEIGLTEGDLRAPDAKAADASKVLVKYLEIRYERHLQVKKHHEPEPGPQLSWAQGVVVGALTVEGWMARVHDAMEHGVARFDALPVAAALDRAWTAQGKLHTELSRLHDENRDRKKHLSGTAVEQAHQLHKTCTDAIAEARAALRQLKPVRVDGGAPDPDMTAVIELYLSFLDAEETTSDLQLSAFDKAVERERLAGHHAESELLRLSKEAQDQAKQQLRDQALRAAPAAAERARLAAQGDDLDEARAALEDGQEVLKTSGDPAPTEPGHVQAREALEEALRQLTEHLRG
jgi:predicted RNase H-like HicB family nuclease